MLATKQHKNSKGYRSFYCFNRRNKKDWILKDQKVELVVVLVVIVNHKGKKKETQLEASYLRVSHIQYKKEKVRNNMNQKWNKLL